MTALEHMADLRAKSIKALQDGFCKLTHEQIWDLENAEFFDPEVLREIQQETEQ